eukprot:m51a1_g12873 hypothetical protein (317) ;mRNA; f:3218-4168
MRRRLQRFVGLEASGAVLASDDPGSVASALHRGLFAGHSVPLYVHSLRDAALAVCPGPAAWWAEMLEEELRDTRPCRVHAHRDPSFRCALSRARAVARVLGRCWTRQTGHSCLPPPAWRPRVPRVKVELPANDNASTVTPETVLFTAAWKGGEFAVCSFTLQHGEVAMFHRRVSPADGPAACSLLLDTMRALTGGAACLVAAPSNAYALAHGLEDVESTAGDMQEFWRPSFFVVSAKDVSWGWPFGGLQPGELRDRVTAAVKSTSSAAAGQPGGASRALGIARCVHCVMREVCAEIVSLHASKPEEHQIRTLPKVE